MHSKAGRVDERLACVEWLSGILPKYLGVGGIAAWCSCSLMAPMPREHLLVAEEMVKKSVSRP